MKNSTIPCISTISFKFAISTAGSNLIGKDNMGETAFSLALRPLEEDEFAYTEKLAVQRLFNLIKGLQIFLINFFHQ
jgi:hypothetical protein